jgi:hypothetical protein
MRPCIILLSPAPTDSAPSSRTKPPRVTRIPHASRPSPMARITAERLVEHLERSGYVVMCKPGMAPHRVDLGDAIERATKSDRGE